MTSTNTTQHAAKTTGDTLHRIEVPKTDTFTPERLKGVAVAFALLIRKLQAADEDIKRIKKERIENDKKIKFLEDILAKYDHKIVDVWCANYAYNLKVGDTYNTMEVPGYYQDETVPRWTTITLPSGNAVNVSYDERSLNIAPSGKNFPSHGDLIIAETMKAAAVYYNCAMEAGHHKWKPTWRYGILKSDTSVIQSISVSDVLLHELHVRGFDKEQTMMIDVERDLKQVPIVYPPCDGKAFKKDDEVLVLFEGLDRTKPKIIGFRREPAECPPSWDQIR